MNNSEPAKASTLIIAPAWVGDMVLMHALILELERQQNTRVDIVAPLWSIPVAKLMPQIGRIEELDVAHGQLGLRARRRLGLKLRSRNYQLAIVIPNSFKSALVPWWAAIPRRVGWRGEMRYGLLTDIHPDKNKPTLVVRAYVALAHPPGAQFDYQSPRLQVPVELVETARQKHGVDGSSGWIALCHGAAKAHKRWPPSKFGELAGKLIKQGYRVVLLGSMDDQDAVEQIHTATENDASALLDLTGKIDLLTTAAILSLCDAVIANDSGLMHIAAGLQLPTVGLYGPTSPVTNPPLCANAQVLTASPDSLASMDKISTDEVYRGVQQVLTKRS